MRFNIITLFPEACDAYLSSSIIGRARKDKKIRIEYQNPRDFVNNKWGKIDERPYGGGPGMVMQALPVVKAVEKTLGRVYGFRKPLKSRGLRNPYIHKAVVVWLSPSGKQFTNKDADTLIKKYDQVVLVCGRYEGIDERAKKILKTLEISEPRKSQGLARTKHRLIRFKEFSVGEATYTGGEVPALAIVDAITRRLPGVLGKDESIEERRVASSAVYTRPEVLEFKKKKYLVPKILLTGHHAHIDSWRKKR